MIGQPFKIIEGPIRFWHFTTFIYVFQIQLGQSDRGLVESIITSADCQTTALYLINIWQMSWQSHTLHHDQNKHPTENFFDSICSKFIKV